MVLLVIELQLTNPSTRVFHHKILTVIIDAYASFYSNFKGPILKLTTIVRIEFSPVVEIGATKGHNLLQEITHEGVTLSYA